MPDHDQQSLKRFFRLPPVLVVLLTCLFFPGRVSGTCYQDPTDGLHPDALPVELITGDGLMNDMGEQLTIFRLVADGKMLKPVIMSGKEGQQVVRDIQRSLRAGGGSSVSGDNWRITMNNQELQASFKYGDVTGRRDGDEAPLLRIRFNETSGPRRSLQITSDDERTFLINLTGGREGFFFRFKQNPDGSIVCWDLCDNCVSTMAAQSFDGFCRKYRDYCEQRLLPILKFTGTGVPETRFSDSTRQSVVNFLSPPGEEEMRNFKQFVADLDSDSFQAREDATARVAENFEQWRNRIELAMDDPRFPVETRHRLRQVYESNIGEDELRMFKSGRIPELAADAEYLVWVLQQAEDTDVRGCISRKLNQLTGQNFGTETSEWIAWINDRQPNPANVGVASNVTFEDLLSSLGPRDIIATDIGNLIRLRVDDTELALDESHWSEQFDGRSAEEVVEQVTSLMRDNRIPQNWFRGGGEYTLRTTGLPQMLFETMARKAIDTDPGQPVRTVTPYRQVSWNRSFEIESLSGSLVQQDSAAVRRVVRGPDDETNMEVPEKTRFDLFIRESESPGRSFHFRQPNGGPTIIEFLYDEANSMVRLVQRPAGNARQANRCQLIEVIGTEVKTLSAANFRQLLDENREYVNNRLLPLLKTLGIELVE